MDDILVRDLIIAEIGLNDFNIHVLEIAEVMDTVSFKEDAKGAEQALAKIVIETIRGDRRYLENKDMLDSYQIESLDKLVDESMKKESNSHADVVVEHESIADFVSIGDGHKGNMKETQQENLRSVKDKEAKLDWIESRIKENPKLTLINISCGKQTANDWLSDFIGKEKDGKFEYFRNKVNAIREISRGNFKRQTTTDKLKVMLTDIQLRKMNTELVYNMLITKYGRIASYGSVRKLISRIRLKI